MSNEQQEEQRDLNEEAEAAQDLDSEIDVDDLAKQLEDAQAKVAEYWDQLVRTKAEMENVKRRATRDVENARKFSVEKFANDLLPVVDSLEQGIASVHEGTDIDAVKEGMELTTTMLIQTLEKQGMIQVHPKGDKFDPEYHEAMTMVPSEEIEADHVIDVFQKGYQLNGRLIRPARVVVSRGAGEAPSIDTRA